MPGSDATAGGGRSRGGVTPVPAVGLLLLLLLLLLLPLPLPPPLLLLLLLLPLPLPPPPPLLLLLPMLLPTLALPLVGCAVFLRPSAHALVTAGAPSCVLQSGSAPAADRGCIETAQGVGRAHARYDLAAVDRHAAEGQVFAAVLATPPASEPAADVTRIATVRHAHRLLQRRRRQRGRSLAGQYVRGARPKAASVRRSLAAISEARR